LEIEEIGSGFSRQVIAWASAPDVVFKFARWPNFNLSEYCFWQSRKDTEVAAHLAPCVDITADGYVLTMKRTTPLKAAGITLPDWLLLAEPHSRLSRQQVEELGLHYELMPYDIKPENLSIFNGRIVLHDYASSTAPLLFHELSR